MFDMDFTEVGNPCILGMAENEMEDHVDRMLAYIRLNKPYHDFTADEVKVLIDAYDIDYDMLPGYLKDKIDKIDIVE